MKSDLHVAVIEEQIKTVADLIEKGADVNAPDNWGETPLHISVYCNNIEIPKILLDAGADANAGINFDDTPFHLAIKSNSLEMTKLLVEANADVNARDKSGIIPLHAAVNSNNFWLTKLLIDAGADVNAKDELCNTALYFAVKSNNIDISKLLVDAGADVHAESEGNDFDSPMQTAVTTRNVTLLKLFMDAGVDLSKQSGQKSDTSLHFAARCGNSSIVRTLLDAGVDVNVRNSELSTPLHVAIDSGNNHILKLLISAGADLEARDYAEYTPLHIAAHTSSIESIFTLLLNSGANVNATNCHGDTPLYTAIYWKNVSVIKTLIKKGACVDQCNDMGSAALEIFIESFGSKRGEAMDKVQENLRLVVEHTNVNRRNEDGRNIVADILVSLSLLEADETLFWNTILKHIAKLKFLNFELDEKLLKVISGFDSYKEYFAKCTKELEEARSTKLNNCWVRFLNLLTDDERKFVKYAGNEDLIKDFKKRVKKFPMYGARMRSNVTKGVDARKSYDKAAVTLSDHWPIFDPTHLIIRDTLNVLSKKDWKKICRGKRSLE